MKSFTNLPVQKIPARLMCDADSKLSSVIHKFSNTHTPLVVYGDKKEFVGLLTVENTLFNRRYDSSTHIRSCLIHPPRLQVDTSVGEILTSMADLKLYTLPVFDDAGNVIGMVKAKAILMGLTTNQFFAETLMHGLPKRSVITISDRSTVGDAFQTFTKHAISRLIVVNEKNKVKGIVSKRDILSPYLVPTKRQRYSTRSRQKNYSFDVEQIKRDKQPLKKYASPIVGRLDESTDTYLLIQNLLKSKYNSVVIVDKNQQPCSIITTKNLLKAAAQLVRETPYLLTIVSKLPDALSQAEKGEVNESLRKIALWVNKQQEFQLMRFTCDVVNSPERKPILFEVKLKITTDSGSYFVRNKDRDFLRATHEAIKQVKKQVRRKE
ncbi:CBS domain-containing protein [Candidatus Woesebacteria bacterium]|nr:CBS domain-containing protein [Candidatus Woesebacteria bacterium]